jgi:RNA polymerase sigma-70 factor (ECF subfamily)
VLVRRAAPAPRRARFRSASAAVAARDRCARDAPLAADPAPGLASRARSRRYGSVLLVRGSVPVKVSVQSLHAEHGAFVWRTLARFGVRASDLEDMMQEVFVVVHRRLDSFDPQSKATTWLFAICMRVASDYRRRLRRKPEDALSPELAASLRAASATPEELAAAQQSRARFERALDAMDDDKRAVFVLYEVERLSCAEIADLVGAKVGTVYSRLHAARAEFRAAFDHESEARR